MLNSQDLNNGTFCRLFVFGAECLTGTENYLDAAMLVNCKDDDYSEGFDLIETAFKVLIRDVNLQSYISGNDFRPSNDGVDEVGYTFFVFVIKHQENFAPVQPIKIEYIFDAVAPADVNGYALVWTRKVVYIMSGGQRNLVLL